MEISNVSYRVVSFGHLMFIDKFSNSVISRLLNYLMSYSKITLNRLGDIRHPC